MAQVAFSSEGGAGLVARETQKILEEYCSSQFHSITADSLRNRPLAAPAATATATVDNFLLKRRSQQTGLMLLRSRLKYQLDLERQDVLHFHWHWGLDMESLLEKNPQAHFVFTLHDERLFTGACHASQDCTKFLSACKGCPITRPGLRFLVDQEYERWKYFLQKLPKVSFIAPAGQILSKASSSYLPSLGPIWELNNPIRHSFLPQSEDLSEKLEKSNGDEWVFGFVATNPHDPNKRLRLALDFVDALNLRGINSRLEIVGGTQTHKFNNKNVINTGALTGTELARKASAWMAILVMSSQENAPLVIQELACLGVPTIASDSGSIRQLLFSKKSGWVDRIGDAGWSEKQLNDCFQFLSTVSKSDRKTLARKAREKWNQKDYASSLLKIYER